MTDLAFSQLPASYPLALLSLQYIATLEDDWIRHEGVDIDSYHVDAKVLTCAYNMLELIEEQALPIPKIEPTLFGGVRFDWSTISVSESIYDLIMDIEPEAKQLQAAIALLSDIPQIESISRSLTHDVTENLMACQHILRWVRNKFEKGIV